MSNIANVGTVSPTEAEAFRAKRPILGAGGPGRPEFGIPESGRVKVNEIVDDMSMVRKRCVTHKIQNRMMGMFFCPTSMK